MPLKPYFAKNNVQIFCADSTSFAVEIASSGALVIADPPYGVNERTNRRSSGRGKIAFGNDFPPVIGDDKPFDPSPWLSCDRLVLWGGNHYANRLPNSSSWLSWDKRDGQGSNDNADCELAWTNLGGPARQFHHTWNGALRASERWEARSHPTQKPIALMRWIIEEFAKDDDLIIDPYMGSGATIIAAMELGMPAIGFEIEERYCKASKSRILDGSILSFAPPTPASKYCSGCNNTYQVVQGITFNQKRGAPDGLQPWCRTCDSKFKRGPLNGWANFQRVLSPSETQLWTQSTYLQLMNGFKCDTCGVDVTEWSGGYWVDRINSDRGYIPSNCRPCCWGCNILKQSRSPESAYQDIEHKVKQYGRGKVPWDQIHSRANVKHISDAIPNITEFIIEDSAQWSLGLA